MVESTPEIPSMGHAAFFVFHVLMHFLQFLISVYYSMERNIKQLITHGKFNGVGE